MQFKTTENFQYTLISTTIYFLPHREQMRSWQETQFTNNYYGARKTLFVFWYFLSSFSSISIIVSTNWSYFSGRLNIASATEAIGLVSILGRVKLNPIKIDIHSFPAWRSPIKETVWSLHRISYKNVSRKVAAWLVENSKVTLQSPSQGNLVDEL